MKIYLAGTGTSHGIPVIACTCKVCRSPDTKDKRMRASAFIRASDGTSIVIDTGPEFRMQALNAKLDKVDAVLMTHSHADHLHGIDDLRIFSYPAHSRNMQAETAHNGETLSAAENQRKSLSVYSNKNTLCDIRERFSYIFLPKSGAGGDKPMLNLLDAEGFTDDNPLRIGSLKIVSVPLLHGTLKTCGWKISDTASDNPNKSGAFFAYITDCSFISEESLNLIRGAEHLVIDSLRERPHPTHLSFSQSLGYAKKIGAKNTWFTHICHEHSHRDIIRKIKKYRADLHIDRKDMRIEPAFDGLTLYC